MKFEFVYFFNFKQENYFGETWDRFCHTQLTEIH